MTLVSSCLGYKLLRHIVGSEVWWQPTLLYPVQRNVILLPTGTIWRFGCRTVTSSNRSPYTSLHTHDQHLRNHTNLRTQTLVTFSGPYLSLHTTAELDRALVMVTSQACTLRPTLTCNIHSNSFLVLTALTLLLNTGRVIWAAESRLWNHLKSTLLRTNLSLYLKYSD